MPSARAANRSVISLWLDDDLAALVDHACEAEGKDRSGYVREAIVEALQLRGYNLPAAAAAPARYRKPIDVEAAKKAAAEAAKKTKALPPREDPERVAARAAVAERQGRESNASDSSISAA